MSGYTPVFNSVYDGTLHGRWPTAAVWVSILPLVDRNGEIRMTRQAIASRTGWPLKLLNTGIEELEQPDPQSQSSDEDGRRLVRLDPKRDWGWRVVNHAKYRERARKRMHDDRRTETGENRERMRTRHQEDQGDSEKTRRDPPSPDETRRDPLSYSRQQTQRERAEQPPTRIASRKPMLRTCPLDWIPSQELRDWAKAKAPLPNFDREIEKIRNYEFSKPRSDWNAVARTWLLRAQEDAERRGDKPVKTGPHANMA